MTITQTVEIPDDHRLVINVPREVPSGQVILTFTTPIAATPSHPCPICAANIDPETGNPRYGPETAAAIEEGRAMLRDEVNSKWFNSLEEMLEDIEKDDLDDN